MALFDLPLNELRQYRPDREEPADFDAFWKRTLDEAAQHELAAEFEPVDLPFTSIDAFDVTYAGWGGDPIRAWLLLPKGADNVGCVIRYIGYNGGRGHVYDHTLHPSFGRATLVVDTRGQGGNSVHNPGNTGDPHGGSGVSAPGWMTSGILDPEQYYYRRVFTDAVRAVDVAAGHPAIDADRIVVSGGSQGGGITQAVAGLRGDVRAALVDVPFLTHYRRAVEVTDGFPYHEIVQYLSSRRDDVDQAFRTLSYFDGVNFAARATASALYSVGLMDEICPPSTVFAAYNHWAGPKEIEVWPFNRHEGGGTRQTGSQLEFLARLS